MKTAADIKISPINMADRKKLDLRAGDTVKVSQKIQEKGKTRIQIFEGLVLARKHGAEAGATFTVRKVSSGYGIERIFPMYSPLIDKIEVVRRAKVRRAKLYYVRTKVAKEINRQMRNSRMIKVPGADEAIVETPEAVEETPVEAKAE